MAKQLKTFEFKHGNAKYPWDRWANGDSSIWRATKDIDFSVAVMSFVQSLRNKARLLGFSLNFAVEGNDVVFQFVKPKAAKAARKGVR